MLYFCTIGTSIRKIMAIITLTSDWGSSGYYAAAVKGVILSQLPDANIVDITHTIAPFDLGSAAFALKNSFPSFPPGTIHIIAVETVESDKKPHVVVKAHGQYFIGTDNGVFSQIFREFEEVYTIDVAQDTDSFNFCERDRFAKVAVMIAQGVPLSEIGERRNSINGAEICAVVRDDAIEGTVIHIDSYENLITNIRREDFEQARRGRAFTIKVKGKLYIINKISDSYLDVPDGELVAIFGTHGYLEIAMCRAKVASLCGIELLNSIRVVFHDAGNPAAPEGKLF